MHIHPENAVEVLANPSANRLAEFTAILMAVSDVRNQMVRDVTQAIQEGSRLVRTAFPYAAGTINLGANVQGVPSADLSRMELTIASNDPVVMQMLVAGLVEGTYLAGGEIAVHGNVLRCTINGAEAGDVQRYREIA